GRNGDHRNLTKHLVQASSDVGDDVGDAADGVGGVLLPEIAADGHDEHDPGMGLDRNGLHGGPGRGAELLQEVHDYLLVPFERSVLLPPTLVSDWATFRPSPVAKVLCRGTGLPAGYVFAMKLLVAPALLEIR